MPTIELGFSGASGVHDPRALALFGPTLPVRIGFDPAYRSNPEGSPRLPDVLHPALLDTGAAESCIDSDLALKLDLPIVDRRAVGGVHGSLEVNMHSAQIFIPELGSMIDGQFAGVHLKAGGQPHLALIGRTFLYHFTMTYEGRTGKVSLSND